MKMKMTDIKTLAALLQYAQKSDKKQFIVAALLLAGAALTACSNDDIAAEQPVNPARQKYTMSVEAAKGSSAASTRALTLSDGGALNATWETSDKVYVQKGSDWATGFLQPQANGKSATLKGSLSDVTFAAGDALTLQTPESGDVSYSGQKGTLFDIALNFDYAKADVTVASVTDGNINTSGTATFTSQQAIIKFTLTDKSASAAINPSMLTITDGTSTVKLTDIPDETYETNGAGVLYVAFPATGSTATITLTATVGTDTYSYTKSGVAFENGKYYTIGVKMSKIAYPITLADVTSQNIGGVVTTDGYVYASATTATAAGKTPVAMICYANGNIVLALALSDEDSYNWESATTTCNVKNTSTAVPHCAWRLPFKSEWDKMINATGGYSALRSAFEAIGGSNLSGELYWSSTEDDSDTDNAYAHDFMYGAWESKIKSDGEVNARACLVYGAIGHALTASVVGDVVGSDGKAYDAADWRNLPSDVTAEAVVAYLGSGTDNETYTHGLAFALSDEFATLSNAKTNCENKNNTAFTDAKWLLPSQEQWYTVLNKTYSYQFDWDGLCNKITNVGGTTLTKDRAYWTTTIGWINYEPCYIAIFYSSNTSTVESSYNGSGDVELFYRAVLVF